MKYAIAIYGSPYTHQAADSAYLFARAVLRRGHQIYRIFFYHDGVYNGNQLAVAPQDEPDLTARWSILAQDNDLELVICVAAALRRGVVDQTEADRYRLPGANLADNFVLSGLGQLVDAGINADRLVTFGS